MLCRHPDGSGIHREKAEVVKSTANETHLLCIIYNEYISVCHSLHSI
uniref:Uncharacterized protein n=1 Tax=Anguilla anguilla TaxID=7936 RepID=A0A0E9QZE3_ANGAN